MWEEHEDSVTFPIKARALTVASVDGTVCFGRVSGSRR